MGLFFGGTVAACMHEGQGSSMASSIVRLGPATA